MISIGANLAVESICISCDIRRRWRLCVCAEARRRSLTDDAIGRARSDWIVQGPPGMNQHPNLRLV
ncbi:hypothetical protein K523DRAFT_158187 [Schizophyllum commune Tattone D]|nr:hypothetical protein K523DRAFT_158187 [Schizophyllum commune Tattone D]